MSLIRKAAEHPVSVLMIYAALLSFGLVSFPQLRRELLPSLSIPVARVIAEYPGVPAQEVESLVTIPMENALSTVKGVKALASVSKDELAAVRLTFAWTADLSRAAVEVREKVDAVYPFLPHGVGKPLVFTEDANERPLLTLIAVPAPDRSLRDSSQLIRSELAARLRQIPGVAWLRIVGLEEAEIKVDVDGQKLAAAGLPLQAVAHTLVASIYEGPVGTFVEAEREYQLRATTGVDSLEKIRRIPVATASGTSLVALEDLAEVYVSVKEATSFFHHDGRKAVGIFCYKAPEAGSLNTARNIRAHLGSLSRMFAGDLELEIAADSTLEIAGSIGSLLAAIGLGILSALVVLLLVFRGPLVPLVVSASIPVSVICVFLFMKVAGLSLNIVSLSGIAIGIGMIVDNSIVVVDSLLRERAVTPQQISAATGRTGSAIFGSTATSLLVFVPIIFIPGITGALFRELALTVSFLLIFSLVCALSLCPALYSLLSEKALAAGGSGRSAAARKVRVCFRAFWRMALRSPLLPIALLVLLSATGAALWLYLPKEVVPDLECGQLEAQVRFSPATTVGECERRSREIALSLKDLAGVDSVFVEAGYARESLFDRSEPARTPRDAHFHIHLAAGQRAAAGRVQSGVEERLGSIPGICFRISRPQDSISRLLGVNDLLQLRFLGEDRQHLLRQAEDFRERLAASGLVRAVEIDTRQETPRIDFVLRPQALAASGIEAANVLGTLRSAVRGDTRASLAHPVAQMDIRVRLQPAQATSPHSMGKIPMASEEGLIEAGLLGEFHPSLTFSELYRQDRKAAVTIGVLPLSHSRKEVLAVLSALHDNRVEFLAASRLAESGLHILAVFLLALLLVYLLVGAQFDSFFLPVLLLAALLPALTGSLLALMIWGYSLNINSILGMLILLGTVINVTIILAAAYEQDGSTAVMKEGKGRRLSVRSRTKSIVQISEQRLKPVAATVLTTIVAVLPIALNGRGQALLQSNTAVALLGGLAVGTLSILLIFPALYFHLRPRR